MAEVQIGDWALREGPEGTLAHLVESLIEDRAVMRCGRQMAFWKHTRSPLIPAPGRFLRCNVCKRIPRDG